ncbi:hypothetical protein SAMN05421788_104209 [Filimonas lacunae]|uniref:Outer membrane protein beta-barrel domain-containing protein n=1 Tax=Filimonas lacunae TaxID=477680 RepID=A0A173M951_9BACT|nr:hypothetical protein [Filimonas lacunae]BAV04053.1 hypothetical protein FLA_0032 [Filimonas lacunae]SIT15975.1 hypothetical protein SAMN05421788_104209 [Filimonas lacunae]
MKFTIYSAALLAILFTSSSELSAQSIENGSQVKKNNTQKGIRLSTGIETYGPLNKNTRSLYEGGYGFYVQTELPVFHSDKFFLTGTYGYSVMNTKEDATGKSLRPDMKRFTSKGGMKYFPLNNFYVQAEVGTSMLLNKSSFDNAKSMAFTFAPRVGYQLPLGGHSGLDMSAKYDLTGTHYAGGKSLNMLALNLGYTYRF